VTTTERASVDVLFTFDGTLHDVLGEAARQGPLATDTTTGATVALCQRDVDELAHDPRLIGVGLTFFDLMGITEGPLRDWYGQLMFTTEGDYHRRIRSLVSRAFTPRCVGALRAAAADMAADAVASASVSGDLLALSSIGTRMICRLLGVPDGDQAEFTKWAEALSPVFAMMTPEQIAGATSAIVEMQAYVDDLTARRAKDPRDDLITKLLAAESDGERLTHAETVTMIANLLVAGHDTAGSQIPCSVLVALQHRDELTGVLDDPARFTSAVSETMRLEPSIPMIPRTTVAPIELHDSTIPAGSLVFLCIASACRDTSAWPDADRFDPDRFVRADAAKLLNFGAGTHYCLGTALAKIAVEEALRAVLAFEPSLHLTEDPAEIPWRQVLGRSPARLTVSSG
jgi:cytochrome P450